MEFCGELMEFWKRAGESWGSQMGPSGELGGYWESWVRFCECQVNFGEKFWFCISQVDFWGEFVEFRGSQLGFWEMQVEFWGEFGGFWGIQAEF